MLKPAANIWDTKIQCVCGVISARDVDGPEIFLSANFGQVSLSPARIAINPNRLYPIEQVIRREAKFAVSVLAASQREVAIRLIRVRRRAVGKPAIVGLPLVIHEHYNVPYLRDSLRTVFCELEQALDTGDHTLMIARVMETKVNSSHAGELPLLYSEVAGIPSRHPKLSKVVRRLFARIGAKEQLEKALQKRRGPSKPDLVRNTYREGGQTEAEIRQITQHGLSDRGIAIAPPERAVAILRQRIGVCVVGVGAWGSYHCRLFRQASPMVELYVCGRDPDRIARVARSAGAKDFVIGLERALEDNRFQALSLVLPHDLHRMSVEMAAAAGKHVLVEKPIATNLEDADAMIEAARRAGIVLMVAEDMHFRPAVRQAVRAIARGDIGEPLYFSVRAGGVSRPAGWKADKARMGGGVLMDLGVHYVRALRLIMGEPERVLATRAMQMNTKMSGEDSVQALFASRYGWQAHMLLSWSSPRGHGPDIVIAGERGTLHLWPGARYFDLYPASPPAWTQLAAYARPAWLAEKLASARLQRYRRPIPERDTRGYLSEVQEFLAAVTKLRPPASTPQDGRRDLEVVLCGYDALEREAWTPIRRITM